VPRCAAVLRLELNWLPSSSNSFTSRSATYALNLLADMNGVSGSDVLPPVTTVIVKVLHTFCAGLGGLTREEMGER
jgi:hypothetical protein